MSFPMSAHLRSFHLHVLNQTNQFGLEVEDMSDDELRHFKPDKIVRINGQEVWLFPQSDYPKISDWFTTKTKAQAKTVSDVGFFPVLLAQAIHLPWPWAPETPMMITMDNYPELASVLLAAHIRLDDHYRLVLPSAQYSQLATLIAAIDQIDEAKEKLTNPDRIKSPMPFKLPELIKIAQVMDGLPRMLWYVATAAVDAHGGQAFEETFPGPLTIHSDGTQDGVTIEF